jgi:hypothetical protein
MAPALATRIRRDSWDDNFSDPGPNIPAIVIPIMVVTFFAFAGSILYCSYRARKRMDNVKMTVVTTQYSSPQHGPAQGSFAPGSLLAGGGRRSRPQPRRRDTDGIANPPPAYEQVVVDTARESERVEGALYNDQAPAAGAKPLPEIPLPQRPDPIASTGGSSRQTSSR